MNKLRFEEFEVNISDYTGVGVEDISQNTDLYEDLCIDSLGIFSLGMYLTEKYGIEVPLSSVAAISTVGDMFSLLNDKGTPSGIA